MAALFDSMDGVDEENDLSTVIGTDTRIASEIAHDDSANTPTLPIRTINGKIYLKIDQSANHAQSQRSLTRQRCLEGLNVVGQWAGSTPLKKAKCTVVVYSIAEFV